MEREQPSAQEIVETLTYEQLKNACYGQAEINHLARERLRQIQESGQVATYFSIEEFDPEKDGVV